MSAPKTERNALMLELNKKGYSYRQIFEELQKKGFSGLKGPKSVGMQLSRLRAKKPVKPERKKPIKPETQIPLMPESQKRVKVTFQIPEKLFIQIKIKAARERKRISDLVGEIFKQYLKGS